MTLEEMYENEYADLDLMEHLLRAGAGSESDYGIAPHLQSGVNSCGIWRI